MKYSPALQPPENSLLLQSGGIHNSSHGTDMMIPGRHHMETAREDLLSLNKTNARLTQSMRTNREIQDGIYMVNTYLLCMELTLMEMGDMYSHAILRSLKEGGLYKHNLKKYANVLAEVTYDLQERSNRSDRDIVTKQYMMCFPSGIFMDDYYADGGNILQRLIVSFRNEMGEYMDRVQSGCRMMAEAMNGTHSVLLADIYMLQALAQTDIELYNECQKTIADIGRGRLKSHIIKSTHSERIRNATRNLTDHFVDRKAICPAEETSFLRKSLADFQRQISPDKVFPIMETCFLSLKMDIIEYFIIRLRMNMEKEGGIGYTSAKELFR